MTIGRRLDRLPVGRGPARRGVPRPRAHLVDHVRGRCRRAGLELAAARAAPGERVGVGIGRSAGLARDSGDADLERLALSEPERERERGDARRGRDHEQRAGNGASYQSPVPHGPGC